MTDFNDRIERLAELDGKATPGPWTYAESVNGILLPPRNKLPANQQQIKIYPPYDSDFICQNRATLDLIATLRNDALPLLREMAQALSEAQAENERLKADAERTDKAFSKALKDLVLAKRESKRFGNQVVLAVNKGCELQTEIERLREGIGRALGELEAGKPGDAESILEALNDA